MQTIKEGKAKIYTYSGKSEKGRDRQSICPTKKLPVFYNPEMEKQRSLTVCVLAAFQKQAGSLDICDPLAGSGVRGIRL